jgi:hypothetical protein
VSRGLGQIQREVREYFRRHPYAALTAEELCRRIQLPWKPPTRSQMVALVRAVKGLAAVYPVGYVGAKRRGNPLVIYRTDNKISCQRAESLCAPNCRVKVLNALPSAYRPKKPEPMIAQSVWYRATALPGAVAAAFKYLLQQGQEPANLGAISNLLDAAYSPSEIAMALTDLQSQGHLDRIRAEGAVVGVTRKA